ncbi:hypothetical protein Acr_05g0016680 [Actinidia rufa]|uniref:Uncharacterized protein n=1 Tax=Actinidia rufa TaxID=165716 RepID=A0A7J0EPT8_9ERIC|nr:hypothetical protein Acr_05g0016680 [Actinidia rufa]
MHLHTEMSAPSHSDAPFEVRCKARHFASCRGSISPPLCAQLERSPPLIKLRVKETRLAVARPSLYSSSKLTLSPSSELLTGYSTLIAPLVSSQTFVHISKYLPVLLYYYGSPRYHYGFSKCPYACFAYLCTTVAFLVLSSCKYHWTHV